jgi:hypothetical protein
MQNAKEVPFLESVAQGNSLQWCLRKTQEYRFFFGGDGDVVPSESVSRRSMCGEKEALEVLGAVLQPR